MITIRARWDMKKDIINMFCVLENFCVCFSYKINKWIDWARLYLINSLMHTLFAFDFMARRNIIIRLLISHNIK